MKIKKLVSVKNCIAALVVGLALSQTTVAAQESCPTVRPGPDWTCAHGGWWPPGMPIPGVPPTAPPQSSDPQGVWLVTVTPRNCVTGVPIPAAAFEALYTFHNDGTMSAWLQNSTITTTRSPNHGLWKRENGSSEVLVQIRSPALQPDDGRVHWKTGRRRTSGPGREWRRVYDRWFVSDVRCKR